VSRAFVKDDSDRPEPPIARVPGDEPNYVTPAGLQKLRDAHAAAVAANDARNVAYYEQRIGSAILDDPSSRKRGVVAFGSTVVTKDAAGNETRITIVGEDEADPASGSISWTSPYAQALLHRKPGDRVTIHRPAGPTVVTILSVSS
jgi:transcription elongation factor GreB